VGSQPLPRRSRVRPSPGTRAGSWSMTRRRSCWRAIRYVRLSYTRHTFTPELNGW